MRIFAISDLHLSNACDKPMDIFGGNWENYQEKIHKGPLISGRILEEIKP